MSTHDDGERLARGLHDEADRFGADAPIGLDAVKRTARGVQRRRRVVTGLAALAVAAVVVPTALAVGGGIDRADQPAPATTSPSPSSSPSAVALPSEAPSSPAAPSPSTADPSPSSPTPTSSGVRTVRLRADTEQHGGEPQISYVLQRQIVKPDGSTVPIDGDLAQVEGFGTGWVGRSTDDQGNSDVIFFDSAGKPTLEKPIGSRLAFSQDGTLVAYTTRDQKLMVAWDGGSAVTRLRTEGPGVVTPRAVVGSQRCDNPEGEGGCMVYYDQEAADGTVVAKVSDRHGIVDTLGPFRRVDDVGPDGRVAGMVSSSDTGSCSAVQDADGKQLWRTCDYSLGRFSRDGRYIIGHPAYADGLGDPLVAVLDARTGKPLVEYRTNRGAFVTTTVWDSDGTLLSMLHDHGWALMRLDRLGSYASVSSGRIAGPAEHTPIVFAGE